MQSWGIPSCKRQAKEKTLSKEIEEMWSERERSRTRSGATRGKSLKKEVSTSVQQFSSSLVIMAEATTTL